MRNVKACLALMLFFPLWGALSADGPSKGSPKEALRTFNAFIGSWRAMGEPEGTRAEKQRGFWTESLHWTWQFKGDDAWLSVVVENGKYFTRGALRYLPDRDLFQLTLTTVAKETVTFHGRLKDHDLTLERDDALKKETQRLTLTLLHGTRLLYRYEVKPQGRAAFVRLYRVGATKEGVAFAGSGNADPECIVSGGRGTIRVSYKGATYFVCCTGCRDAFQDDPEKFIREFQAKKAQETKQGGP